MAESEDRRNEDSDNWQVDEGQNSEEEYDHLITSPSGDKHNYIYMALIFGSAAIWFIALIFNYLSVIAVEGLYANSTGNISKIYPLEITPKAWVFQVNWSIIYIWLAIGLAYAISTIFRRVRSDVGVAPYAPYIYASNYGIPIYVYGILSVNFLSNITWIFVWNYQYLWPSFFVILITPLTLYVIIFFLTKDFPRIYAYFYEEQCKENVLRIVCFHNAIAVYAGWVTPATLINFGVCLVYGGPEMSNTDASTFMLSIWIVLLLVWCPLELTVFRQYMMGIIAHYLTLLFGIIAIFQRFDSVTDEQVNSILALVILILVSGFFLAKIVLTIVMFYCAGCFESRKRMDYQRL